MKTKQKNPSERIAIDRIVWFTALAHARLRNRPAKEVEARRALRELGVTVRFGDESQYITT